MGAKEEIVAHAMREWNSGRYHDKRWAESGGGKRQQFSIPGRAPNDQPYVKIPEPRRAKGPRVVDALARLERMPAWEGSRWRVVAHRSVSYDRPGERDERMWDRLLAWRDAKPSGDRPGAQLWRHRRGGRQPLYLLVCGTREECIEAANLFSRELTGVERGLLDTLAGIEGGHPSYAGEFLLESLTREGLIEHGMAQPYTLTEKGATRLSELRATVRGR
jgi:hypothetical protein